MVACIIIMGLLNLLGKVYGEANPWSVKSEVALGADDIAAIKSGVVTEGKFGKTVCLTLVSGGTQYANLGRDSKLEIGEEFPIAGSKIITLSREGDADIIRIQEA